jgi:hypothetical protein
MNLTELIPGFRPNSRPLRWLNNQASAMDQVEICSKAPWRNRWFDIRKPGFRVPISVMLFDWHWGNLLIGTRTSSLRSIEVRSCRMESGRFLPLFREMWDSRLKSRPYQSKFYKYEQAPPGPIGRRRKVRRRILGSDFPLFLRSRSQGCRNAG